MKIRKSLNNELNKVAAKAEQGKMRPLTLTFDEADICKLKAKAALDKSSMSAILRKLIKDYV